MSKKKISVLVNAFHYSFEMVLLVDNEAKVDIVVKDTEKAPVINSSYKDGKGAKIAFLKLYGYRLERSACIAKLQKKASWTPFYPPEPGWLKETFPGLEFEEGE